MWLPSPLERAYQQVREDLAADPYLAYILLLSALLSSFWVWHRLPNFATRDERWRVVDVMEVAGFVVNDEFSLEALQEGTKYWRVFGPTLYLYALVALPAIAIAVLIGDASAFGDIFGALGTDLYAHWQAIPAWLWWATVLPARLTNVAFAVGSVYLLYRIGTHVRDRATGRLAALLLSLTWAVIVLAHEAGEDVPALFCVLLVFYLAVRYVEAGSRRLFLGGSAVGGLAIAFKPTAGVTAILLGVAYLLRAGRVDDPKRALFRPELLVGGPILAVVVMYLSFPSAVVNTIPSGASGGVLSEIWDGPEVVLDRVDRVANEKTRSHGWLDRPAWWWYVRGAANGLGWPLALASVGGVAVGVATLGRRALVTLQPDTVRSVRNTKLSLETAGIVLALSVIAVMTTVFSTWAYFRTHHLLLLFPMVILLVALGLQWLDVEYEQAAHVLTVVLLVSTAIYAGVGTVGYADQPRDAAVGWLHDHGGANATVETYAGDSQEAAVPHGWTIYRPTAGTDGLLRSDWMQRVEQRCPDYIVLNYQRAMIWLAPDNHSRLSERWTYPGDAEYVRDLLAEDGPYESEQAPYPYDVAATFGREPPFLDDGEPYDRTWNVIRAGIYPRTIEYGDPQDVGVYGYAVVLERTGACES
ncbi:ArnT family glycosyltransferase [Halapricum hydrolyticum]|uniref:Glycosyltransferase family 39 protein n=1 Tax=Halapricum hydrolyticum TaxID=2979991 RepID=A0AAE3IAW9_9EURY|nr:glycosyltransferase family 39 protein [Halapricum hydrolyticum]MCU4717694.1 glycosyltransferase family 39 protein [Halapricum hydrolyticum]MCU4726777.1 glycosyltransferase family 39 protein [Halapricum hydrolyticum]